MKIVFIEPRPPEPHVYSKFKIPRLGCVLLGTILRDAGYNVTIFVEEIGKINWDKVLQADVVAISTTTSTTPRGYMFADRCKKAGKIVIMGGSHVTFCVDEALQHCDYVVRGEGETVILDLIRAIEEGKIPENLNNISFKKDGVVINNPGSGFIQNLDTLPIPDFELIEGWKSNPSVVSIETSRGCPFNCSFCSVILMFGRRYRFKSVERVVTEVTQYMRETNPRHVFFCDDNFTANPQRTKQLLRRFIELGLNFEWSAQVRVEAANDPEMLDLMKQTNCYAVYVGFESINPRTLEAYNKHQSVEQIKKAIEQFHRHDIHIHGMFVLGSDEDDVNTIYETVDFAKKMRIDSVQFLILTPLPGTPFFTEIQQQGRIFNHDWSYYDGHNVVFEPARMTAYELQIETLRAMNKFYTYTSILRYLIKLDNYYALVRLYGKYMVYKALKTKEVYANQLRHLLGEKMKALREIVKAIPHPLKIGISDISLERQYKEFFQNFFKQLGLKVVLPH
ncbi:MAG: B12-binding domain-containing radical SAM protein, partial [Candidatus Sumerlaeia bacterium]|nr:B12-binding domain-containing radical SAM protein [Candidatus Sumerlaeia bacterium]